MKRLFLMILVFFIIGFSFPVFAQTPTLSPRYAACDLCGYCQVNGVPQPTPGSWKKCAECLYPGITNATSNETLKVDPETNAPPTPYLGRQYTMLGCISTNLSSFQKEGAAGSVVQALLNTVFSVVGGLTLVSLIYGVFIIATSQANPERLNFGKRVVYGVIIGVIFVLSSVFIINIIGSGVLKIPGFSTSSP